MGLLPTIDKQKTEENVKNYLANDFQRLIVKAGYNKFQLQSPGFSDMPKAQMVGNPLENKLVSHIDAIKLVNSTVKAIERCPEPYRDILKLAYVQGITDEMILAQIPYERTRYYELKMAALLWFADSFEQTFDLHKYKKAD